MLFRRAVLVPLIAPLTALLLALGLVPQAAAQFPSKPIRFMVPYSPGGALDATLRLVADQMSASLGQPVLLEHKPGGATTIAAAAVLQLPADGHAIFINAISYVTNPLLMSKYPYDPVRDFTPVTLAISNPHVLVAHPGMGVKGFADFVSSARARGKSMSYASIGPGSSSHLGFELFKKDFGFDMLHVPYKGVPQAILDVAGGQVQAMLIDQPVVAGQVRGGKLTGVAIASERRSAVLPDVPTFGEAGGKPFLSRSWFGMMVRSGAPAEAVQVLHREIAAALNKPEIRERLANVGTDAIASSPADFAVFLRSESERFAEAIRISGTKLE
jgi:tripartite-type tricarboxylate transporter receptor subunit TctC